MSLVLGYSAKTRGLFWLAILLKRLFVQSHQRSMV